MELPLPGQSLRKWRFNRTADERKSEMAAKGVIAILTGYFNSGDGKRPNGDWLAELKNLTPEEKAELATGVCEITGDTIK
jgi:hypothetical protein